MNGIPVGAQRLHRRTIEVDGERRPKASLFPFFEAETGRVRALMLIDEGSSEITIVPWTPGRVRVPLLGAIRLRTGAASHRVVWESDAFGLGGLWHFDPWWVLGEERYEKLPVVAGLKLTNAPPRFTEPIAFLFFKRDLSAALGVRIDRGESVSELVPWHDRLLPRRPPEQRFGGAAPAAAWQLDPVWDKWSRLG